MRIAFTGASGTGKTTLTDFVALEKDLPINPVGSRSVAKDMGFENPYDVDKAGRRAEFQNRLLREKIEWEAQRPCFVTDRTTLDNLAYAMMHDVHSIDAQHLALAIGAFNNNYDFIFYCPYDSFCEPGTDVARVKDKTYHRLYDATILGLMKQFARNEKRIHTLRRRELQVRKSNIRLALL